MLRLVRSSSGLWLLWLALFLAFVFMRPQPFSVAFWLLAAAVVLVGFAQMARARGEATAQRNAFAEWSNRLSTLGVHLDVEDDGHLFEWLDPPHWQQVFALLEEMPQGLAVSVKQYLQATRRFCNEAPNLGRRSLL